VRSVRRAWVRSWSLAIPWQKQPGPEGVLDASNTSRKLSVFSTLFTLWSFVSAFGHRLRQVASFLGPLRSFADSGKGKV
jgi:hypothetical protein